MIGIIVVIISFAVCIALCIRQSAADSKEDALSEMNITAQISPDREAIMEEAMEGGTPGEFDSSLLSDAMSTALSLDELEEYAKADSVQSFYYTMTAYVNGSGGLEAYSTSSDDDTDSSGSMMQNMPEGLSADGDFTVTGFSSDESMTEFVEGTCTIEEGAVFEEGTDQHVCIIPDELANYNGLEVGDTIEICSTDDESETYMLEITGIYSNSQASAQAMDMSSMMGGGGMTDPANNIYMSYTALNDILLSSDSMDGTVNGTYVLGTEKAYESFQAEVKEMGLSDEYTVSSTDLTTYEMMSQPLESLATFVGYFLIVILGVGAIILVVLNIFATRERKYEIGILTAIGMKKQNVAKLFMSEILIITLAGVVIGGGIGAALSVPVSNGLLSLVSQQATEESSGNGFGRNFGGMPPGSSDMQGEDSGNVGGFGDALEGYMSDISASVDLVVLLQMLAACMLLALVAGMVSVIAIMRYKPLEILSNRD
ncbi:MAG: ABC transporter permease [Bacillota bacterium]|nr:ABC transporter permease [Bacillota bacterium]